MQIKIDLFLLFQCIMIFKLLYLKFIEKIEKKKKRFEKDANQNIFIPPVSMYYDIQVAISKIYRKN